MSHVMNINIVTNALQDKGLARDALILESLLVSMGHVVNVIDFRQPKAPPASLTIWCEVVVEHMLSCSPRHWWFPNPEWASPRYLAQIGRMERVCCKTQEALRLFAPLTTRAVFVGFESEDMLDESILRQRAFFHAARDNAIKGTGPVKEAWKRCPELGLTLAGGLAPGDYKQALNRSLFHLCPSEYEGWGHCIHEALSVGGIVITTDAAPMREVPGIARTVPVVSSTPRHLGALHKVSADGVADAMRWCSQLSDVEIETLRRRARAAFEAERRAFRETMRELVSGGSRALDTGVTKSPAEAAGGR